MTRFARIDANQREIVLALREVGASVQSLATVGNGCPDLLIGWRGENLLLEIKDGLKRPSKRLLTADECRWHHAWRGRVQTVLSVSEAIAVLGVR